MTDKPIIFSAPIICALLDGRKTMTRRVLKPQPNRLNGGRPLNDGRGSYSTDAGWKRLPYAVGDRLWVREGWRDGTHPTNLEPCPAYKADGKQACGDEAEPLYGDFYGWKSPIHMPRRFSRLTLAVTAVKVERLQEISEEDAVAEGLTTHGDGFPICTPRKWFEVLWNPPHSPDAWDANPWVVVPTFTVHKINIDQMEEK